MQLPLEGVGVRWPKRQAIAELGLDEKLFKNFYETANEFTPLPRPGGRGPFYFDPEELKAWLASYQRRTKILKLSDYYRCLDFALAMHFRGYVLSDWGTGRQREFGQKISNWVRGQLGEVAVQKFLRDEFGVRVKLDFEIRGQIVEQDIIGVKDGRSFREPRLRVGIKSSKPKNSYLILGDGDLSSKRESDIYIFCRPDLPDDHLLRVASRRIKRVLKAQRYYNDEEHGYCDKITGLASIPCEVAGYCYKRELEAVRGIPGQDFSGTRHVKKSGDLHRSLDDWAKLLAKL